MALCLAVKGPLGPSCGAPKPHPCHSLYEEPQGRTTSFRQTNREQTLGLDIISVDALDN
jgi:hypothetical protein